MKGPKHSKREELSPAKRRTKLTPAQALRTVRELQDMSQTDLARASGIPQTAISAMENGRATVGVERGKKLARLPLRSTQRTPGPRDVRAGRAEQATPVRSSSS